MSKVHVAAYALPNFHETGGITLRIIAPTSFIASDGTLVQGNDPSFYQELTCTLSGTNLTIPAFVIDSTTDCLSVVERSQAVYSAYFYRRNGKLISLFANFQYFRVPPIPNPTTWPQVALYASSLPPIPFDTSLFYTKDQVDFLLSQGGGGGGIPPARRVDTGTGLQGGGDLSVNRIHSLTDKAITPGPYVNPNLTVDQQGRISAIVSGTTGGDVPSSRLLTAGSGLTGGGDLTADRTFAVEDIGLGGAATNASIQWDSKGRITVGSSGTSPGPGGSDFELEQFGGAADDGITDNLVAFNNFISHLRGLGYPFRGGTLRLRRGQYYSSGPWKGTFQLRIVGSGPSQFSEATSIRFAGHQGGYIVGRTGEDGDPGGDGSIIENICFTGTQAGTPDGTCNVSGGAVTRVTGPAFNSVYANQCHININGAVVPVGTVTDADHLTLGSTECRWYLYSSTTIGNLSTNYNAFGVPSGTIYIWNLGTTHTITGYSAGLYTFTPAISDLAYVGSQVSVSLAHSLGTQTGVPWVMGTRHGLELHARAIVKNCTFLNFPGMGINVDSQRSITPTLANNNLSQIERCRIVNCWGHGMFFFGNDANACHIEGVDCTDNVGWGVKDSSFLGNTFVSMHTAGNLGGSYFMGDTGNVHTCLIASYAEDDQSGYLGNYGALVLGGTHNFAHYANVATAMGPVFTGNQFVGPIYLVIGASRIVSSGQGGAQAVTRRNMLNDNGSAVILGSPAIVNVLDSTTICNYPLYPNGRIAIQYENHNPTTGEIPDGLWTVWKNTISGEVRVWANNGGVLNSILLTP